MLTSITPVGEVARSQRWSRTSAWFVVGSVTGGALRGLALGTLGRVVLGDTATSSRLFALATFALLGGLAEWRGALPTLHRQVDERWLTTYRGWVYGGGFGLQLGLGVATIVPTALVWTVLAAELLTASPVAGLVIGATFGAVRGLPLLLVRDAYTHARLAEILQRVEAWRGRGDRVARVLNAVTVVTAVALAVIG